MSNYATMESLFFHTWRESKGGKRMVEQQGRIVKQVSGEICLVEFFSWIDGTSQGMGLVEVATMLAGKWTFYATHEEFASHGDREKFRMWRIDREEKKQP